MAAASTSVPDPPQRWEAAAPRSACLVETRPPSGSPATSPDWAPPAPILTCIQPELRRPPQGPWWSTRPVASPGDSVAVEEGVRAESHLRCSDVAGQCSRQPRTRWIVPVDARASVAVATPPVQPLPEVAVRPSAETAGPTTSPMLQTHARTIETGHAGQWSVVHPQVCTRNVGPWNNRVNRPVCRGCEVRTPSCQPRWPRRARR